MNSRPRICVGLSLALLLSLAAQTAGARCALDEIAAAGASVSGDLGACGATSAKRIPPPKCIESMSASLRALAAPDCDRNQSLSVAERRCQQTIARVSGDFFAARLAEIAQGKRQTTHAQDIDQIVEACRTLRVRRTASGTTVPTVGPPCGQAGGTPGEPFDSLVAARCLRGVLSNFANAAAPIPLSPNFVVILTDDQRWDTTTHMPSLNREIRRYGMNYSNAFVNTPICAPSRASFLTGRYASQHGVRINSGAASDFDDSLSVAKRLHAAGYHTGLFGIYLADLTKDSPPQGWDEWYVLQRAEKENPGVFPALRFLSANGEDRLPESTFDEVTDQLRDKADTFLSSNAEVPFFLWVGMLSPHQPAVPAQRHAESLSDLPPFRPPNWREEDVSDKPNWVRFMKAISKEEGIKRLDELRLFQMRSLLAVDDAIGVLSNRLEKLGLTDDTVFVFASDNGHLWGEHWLSSKFALYEEAVRVPLIIRYPRLSPPGQTNTDLALNVDLAWTLADLGGRPIEPPGTGQSLAGSLQGQDIERDEIFFESPRGLISRPSSALRTKRWKYILTDAKAGITEELYDLESDPYEMQNVAEDTANRTIKESLARRLRERLQDQ